MFVTTDHSPTRRVDPSLDEWSFESYMIERSLFTGNARSFVTACADAFALIWPISHLPRMIDDLWFEDVELILYLSS
jgi:hypothetical protein